MRFLSSEKDGATNAWPGHTARADAAGARLQHFIFLSWTEVDKRRMSSLGDGTLDAGRHGRAESA